MEHPQQRAGIIAGLTAYVVWGLLTIYWKQLRAFDAFELIGWRIVASAAVMAVVLTVTRRWGRLRVLRGNRALIARVAAASILLTANWTAYVYAVVHGQVLETALGYLIAPIGTVTVGVLVLHEPTTAVDILTQRSIIKVLKQLRQELNFSVIFISHDLAVAAEIADTVVTMYAGEIIEMGPVGDVFYRPQHAYTLGLLEAAPRLSAGAEELQSIPGSPPDLISPPSGCKFHVRCRFKVDQCEQTQPPLITAADTSSRPIDDAAIYGPHTVACYQNQQVLETRRKELSV